MTNCSLAANYMHASITPRSSRDKKSLQLRMKDVFRMHAERTNLFELGHWLAHYALRRWTALLGVAAAMLLKIGLDLLKPWPMVFLVDFVLQGKVSSALFPRIAETLPGG